MYACMGQLWESLAMIVSPTKKFVGQLQEPFVKFKLLKKLCPHEAVLLCEKKEKIILAN